MASMMASLSRRERNVNINVGSFHPNRKHSEISRWVCIYPAYINSKKTVAEGRQVPLKNSVENPTINEIRDVLVNAGFHVEVEANKVYPRELDKYEMLSRGRIRVQLKNDDGTFIKPNFTSRKSVFVYVAETIPKLKTRGSGASKQAAQSTDQSKANKKTTKKR